MPSGESIEWGVMRIRLIGPYIYSGESIRHFERRRRSAT